MLTENDVEYMRQASDEIYTLRQRDVTLVYKSTQKDPATGVVIGESEERKEVKAVVTEISLRSATGARYRDDGIEYEQGDVKIDVKLEYVKDIYDIVSEAIYDGVRYKIVGYDKKGIGARNRVEFLGREIA